MSVYEFVLWLHISASMVGLGATFATAVLSPVALSMDPRNLPFVHRVRVTVNRRFGEYGLVLIIATGVFQVIDGNWDFGAFWISAAFLIVFLLGGLLGGYLIPTDRKLEGLAVADIRAAGDGPVELSREYLDTARKHARISSAAGALVLLAALLMVWKPGA